jgi:hydroxymethylpyrimidine kinase/phosphomethylpyrimidine kinase
VTTIAGSDPTGGAGIQGDLKTFAAHGVYGAAVVTALTAQNHAGVQAMEAVAPALVAAQLTSLFDQVVPAAAKTGMLCSPEVVAALADFLVRRPVRRLVVDPCSWRRRAGRSRRRDSSRPLRLASSRPRR